MSRFANILKPTYLLITLTAVKSLDIEGAKEHLSCKEPAQVALDILWCMRVDTWYYITGSRLDLYTFAAVIAEKDFEEFREDEIYYNGCLKYAVDVFKLKGVVTGFKQPKKYYGLLPFSIFDYKKFNFIQPNGDIDGPCYTSLTDNKTFVFIVCCHSPHEMAWFVNSPLKTLPEDTLKTIEDYARSLGFQQKHFVRLRHDFCDDDDDDILFKSLQHKNEL